MVDVSVYVSLQQSDLHCISAFESIRHSLGFTALKGLRRYRLLRVSVATDARDVAEAEVHRFIGVAFDIVNPNKESVTFGEVSGSSDPHDVCIGMEVAPMEASLRTIAAPSLAQFPKIHAIDQRLFWVLTLQQEGVDDATLIRSAEVHCGPTRSRTQGLLVNPLFETVSVRRLS
jgi:hypothetical protein